MLHLKKALIALFFGTLISLCLLACGNGEQSKQLSAPQNLRVIANILEWDKVDNATEYLVDINGEEYHTDTNSLDIFLLTDKVGKYRISVTACDGTGEYVFSEMSKKLQYDIEKPDYLKVARIVDTDEYQITGVTDKAAVKGKVIIPSETEDGFPITEIAMRAFEDCTEITSVIVPDCIQKIGSHAFENCKDLNYIKLSENLSELDFCLFYNCESLEQIDIPQGVMRIDGSVFYNCRSLKSVDIPIGVTKIDGYIFSGCDAMDSIFIPANVNYIDNSVLSGMKNLQSVTIDKKNSKYKSDGNCIILRENNELVCGREISVIPDYVTAIRSAAFWGCSGFEKITVPGNVKRIGGTAFYLCRGLKEIVLSEGVQTIGDGVFEDCSALQKVVLPESLQSMGNRVFQGCSALTEITIPAAMENLSGRTFAGCDNLKSIKLADGNTAYEMVGDCIMRKSDGQVVWGCETSVIPSYAKSIGACAFTRALATSITLPDGVEIEGSSFANQTVYTSLIATVDDINSDTSVYSTINSIQKYKCNVLSNCELADDNGIAYVKSYTHMIIAYRQPIRSLWLYGSIKVPYRKGYTFMGWATEEDSDVVVYPNTEHTDSNGNTYYTTLTKEQRDTIPSGTTLYAVWQKQE